MGGWLRIGVILDSIRLFAVGGIGSTMHTFVLVIGIIGTGQIGTQAFEGYPVQKRTLLR